MKRKSSITETLVEAGFTIRDTLFEKDDIKIPFEELIGHTVGSFLEKCKRRGWLSEVNDAKANPNFMI